MKNVAILITKLTGGGAERAAANLSVELSKLNNVKIIVFDGENQSYSFGGELIDLDMPPKKGIIGKFNNVIKRTIAVKKIKKNHNIEHSISFMDGPNLINVLSKRKEQNIISIRNYMSISKKRNMFLTKLLTKFIFYRADKIVAVAKAIEADLVKNFGADINKVETINNYCDIDKIVEQINDDNSIPMNFEKNINYIVTAGRLTEQKGHWHLIRAFKKVLNLLPNTKLVVLGDGEYKKRLISLSNEMGIGESVIFLGYVNNPHAIIARSQIFAFPSLYEGFSNSLLEAMACNVAIVSSDCDSGSREIVAPETPFWKKTKEIEFANYGVITPVCNGEHFNSFDPLTREENLLADALYKLLINDSLRESYSKKSIVRLKEFSPEKVSEYWKSLIE